MRATYQLNQTTLSQQINLNNFQAALMYVQNRSGSPIAVRTGGTDVPNAAAADHLVPPNGYQLITVDGASFAVGFTDLTAITGNVANGLGKTATITLLSAGEEPPAFGSMSSQTLASSEATDGLIPFPPTVKGPFDLLAWGGMQLLVLPTSGTGQGICQVEVSEDLATWSIFGQWAFWPGIPLAVAVPRTTRYLRVLVNSAGIPGDPAVGGLFCARFTIEEISQLAATPGAQTLSKAIGVPSVGSQAFTFATLGLPAITARAIFSGGLNAQIVVSTSSSPTGPWAQATEREQSIVNVPTIVRSIGNLDAYLQIEIFDTGTGGLAGSLNLAIQQAPDTTTLLNSILSALGDVSQTPNVGQSIYHQLALWLPGMGYQPLIDAKLQTLITQTDQVEAQLATLITQTDQVEAQLATLITQTDQLETLVAATNTKLDTLIAAPNNPGSILAVNINIATAGVYALAIGSPIFTSGDFIDGLGISFQAGTPLDSPGFFLQLALGTAVAAITVLYGGTGPLPENTFAPLKLSGPKVGGIAVPTGQNYLWAFCTAAPTLIVTNIVRRAP